MAHKLICTEHTIPHVFKCTTCGVRGPFMNFEKTKSLRKIARSECKYRHDCLSVRSHGKTKLLLEGYSQNFTLECGILKTTCWHIPILFKIGQSNVNFTRIPTYFPISRRYLFQNWGRWFSIFCCCKFDWSGPRSLRGMTSDWRISSSCTQTMDWSLSGTSYSWSVSSLPTG